MAEERGAERDDEREAEVLSERELMGLVATGAAPDDVPRPERESEEDEED